MGEGKTRQGKLVLNSGCLGNIEGRRQTKMTNVNRYPVEIRPYLQVCHANQWDAYKLISAKPATNRSQRLKIVGIADKLIRLDAKPCSLVRFEVGLKSGRGQDQRGVIVGKGGANPADQGDFAHVATCCS